MDNLDRQPRQTYDEKCGKTLLSNSYNSRTDSGKFSIGSQVASFSGNPRHYTRH